MNAIKRYLVALAFATTPLLAQETEAAAKADGTLLYWKIANFLILAGLIGWLVKKEGGPALQTRSQAIGEGLAAGEKAKAEAEERATQVNAKLANLASEIAVMQSGAREELARESDRIREDAKKEIARIKQQFEQEVESAGKIARLELHRYVAKLAIDLAEQKVRAGMTPDVQAALLQSFVDDFPRAGQAS